MTNRGTLIEAVADHLKRRGHITKGTAILEFGFFHLGDIIYRLRHERSDLLPPGTYIKSVPRRDGGGNLYTEYVLARV